MKNEEFDILELEDWKAGFWVMALLLFIAAGWIVSLKVDIIQMKYETPHKIVCNSNACMINNSKYIRVTND